MNTTRSQKIKAAKAAKASSFASQTITIDHHWKILRSDERNWELQFNRNFKGFYGDLYSALSALPAKMLSEAAKNDLADVLRCHRAILVSIKEAIGNADSVDGWK